MTTTLRRPASSLLRFDGILIGATILLAVVGIVMVYSATRGALIATGLSPTYFAERQVIWVFLGIVGMLAMWAFDYRHLETMGMVLYGLFVLSLLAVLTPGVGSHALGSQRWFSLGPLQLQPSEFAVIGLLITVATYCARRSDGLTWSDVIRVLILGGIPIILVILQPDLGTGIIMGIILLVMLAVAGLPTRLLIMLLVGAVAAVALAVVTGVFHKYQITRITSFLHQDVKNPTPAQREATYNLSQSKDAIGAGGLWGTGFLRGTVTNLGYVPEEQTDFIFTAVGEQLGFVGSTIILALEGLIAWRVLRAAQLARDSFGRLVCAGVFTFLAFSTFQNAGMTMGIMPITGIPLPFLSYGGSAVLCFFLGIGLALSVTWRRTE